MKLQQWGYSLSIGVAAALLAACGGSGPPLSTQNANAGVDARVTHQSPASSSYRVLHRFSLQGRAASAHPYASLVAVKGTLYGTTSGKGSDDECGTVFGISPTGVDKTLYRFHGPDGCSPKDALIEVNGTLYGTTEFGGQYSDGVVFSLTTSGAEKVVYGFHGAPDGQNPVGGLVDLHGTLYGTTEQGGLVGGSNCPDSVGFEGCGTVYSVTTSGAESVLHAFKGEPDGFQPQSRLIGVNGKLYGTTTSGGLYWGTVFSITTTGSESVVYSFKGGADGNAPYGPLIGVKGKLYGTTLLGGSSAQGTIFDLTLSGSENVLHSFAGGSDGQTPAAGLLYANGVFYGTTDDGGDAGCSSSNGCGTVYSFTPSGSEKVLHRFASGSDGSTPQGALVELNGTLFGTTIAGGGPGCSFGCGTVYSLTP